MRYFEKIAVRNKDVDSGYKIVRQMVQELRQPRLEIVQRPERDMMGEMVQEMAMLPNRRATAEDLWIPEASTRPTIQGNKINLAMQDYLKKFRP